MSTATQDTSKPETLLREKQVLQSYAPVHRTTWWRWVKAKTAPQPIRLGPHTIAWRESDLKQWQAGTWKPTPADQPKPA